MQARSNIKESLNKKKQASIRKKLFWYSILVLVLISLALWGLTNDKIKIKDIKVSGNNSISTDEIMVLVNNQISKKYIWFIPTNNLLLLRKSDIIKDLLNSIKKINSIDIDVRGVTSIEIIIKERESKNLWCAGNVKDNKKCYFMDSNGYIFEESPSFSEGSYPEYFGLIIENNPVGQYYFKDNFKNISGLFDTLKRISFHPKYFLALDEHEYEVYILGGGKILINDKKSFESSLTNLQALVTNGYIKIDDESLKKIKYIDLRFGNKVNFDLNK